MGSEKYIRIEDEAFKTIMNKLDRIENFIKESQIPMNGKQTYTVDSQNQKEYLKAQEAADLLGVSVRTLARYRKAKKIEYIQHTDNGSISYNYNSLIRYRDSIDSKDDASLLSTIFTTSEQK